MDGGYQYQCSIYSVGVYYSLLVMPWQGGKDGKAAVEMNKSGLRYDTRRIIHSKYAC